MIQLYIYILYIYIIFHILIYITEYIYIHSFHILFHYGLSHDIEYGFLCYIVGPVGYHPICNSLHIKPSSLDGLVQQLPNWSYFPIVFSQYSI